ncbi:MAG: FtsQ-type POTRA domain-containing protein [Actinobacteria bacterium]|nr:FtsQ-type POTRA domain-containing protein [Actinomycetota bacterium]
MSAPVARLRRRAAPRPAGARWWHRRLARWGLARAPVRLPAGVHHRVLERRRAVLAERDRRDRQVTVSLAVLLSLALAAVGLARSPLFAVERVAVVGVDDRQAEVRARAGVEVGVNLLDVDLTHAARRVEQLPWVERAVVHRRLPSTVEIRVAARAEVAVVEGPTGAWVVAADGTVLRAAGGRADPPIRVISGLPFLARPGEPTRDAAVLAALEVHDNLPPLVRDWVVAYHAPNPRRLEVTVTAATDGGPFTTVVRFGPPERIRDKAAVLVAVLDELVAGDVRPGDIVAIDVRAPDHPVVVPG